MASVTKNTSKVRRVASGMTLVINDGTDDITIDNITPDSVVITDPFYERVDYKKGNKPQVPLEGDVGVPSIEFNAIAGAIVGTQELLTLAIARSATDNKAKLYTSAVLKIPDYDGATTGQSITMTSPWFQMPPNYKGGNPDTIEGIKLCCLAAGWAKATY